MCPQTGSATLHYGPGRFRTLADDAGVLQAPKCYDSGGRYVDDLSRATKIGTVYGVDWVGVPDRDTKTVDVRKQFGAGEITRARKLEGMWWATAARTSSPRTPVRRAPSSTTDRSGSTAPSAAPSR